MAYPVFMQCRDPALGPLLAEHLSASGYPLADRPEEAALCLLEAEDKIAELCAQLRDSGFGHPILVLGLSSAAARAVGANDGLEKPFRLQALLQVLPRFERSDRVPVGRFRLDAKAREMTDDQGGSVRLTEKEAAILLYLAKAGDQPVGRDELLGEVWGYASGASTHTVETHIYRLRRKLGAQNAAGLLVTEAGGYRLT